VRCRTSLDVLLEVGDALLAAPAPLIAVSPGSREPWTAIAELRSRFGRHMLVGAGLVDTPGRVAAALAAGAQFVLCAQPDAATARTCAAAGVAYVPGVSSVAGAAAAQQFPCAGLLLFPACRAGIKGAASLHTVAAGLPLIAAGGVRGEEVASYRQAGVAAIAVRGVLGPNRKWVMAEMIRQVRRLQTPP
jgi:2-keto-3-deoxy-6-phosphogluconate aldolase